MGAIAGEELKKMGKIQAPMSREEKILVLVRLRPLSEKEIATNEVSDWECINDTTVLYRNTLREGSTFPSAYTFDRVYRGDCTTRQVYEEGAKEIALSVVNGINSSIFAYGQTSSGKTYTMTGITELAVADIFDHIHQHEERAFAVKFSAIEIYNEAIRDLLSSDSSPLRLRDDPEKGAIVEKATEETLRDWNHLKELLSICDAQRKIGETSLNERSSRSHQIIRLTVESSAREFLGKENSTNLVASVNFIDLAGSERASQAMSAGTRLKEGCHINRSLLTLGTVIRKLSKGRQGHINYRDSKLTRILQPCLGGNARTAIVCTLSPARSHVEQTRNTLLFACCAKEVTTKAQVNVVMSDKALVKHLQRELARLESELRNPAPAVSSCDYPALLRKRDLQIQKMEKEIKDLKEQRDLAQSRLEDFMRMVAQDESSMSGTPHFHNHKDDAWEDGLASEISGVVDPDRASFVSDSTSTPVSTARAYNQSDSVDDLDEMFPRRSGDSDEYCKEVQCIEMEEANGDINNEENEEGTIDQEAFQSSNVNGNGEIGHNQNGFAYLPQSTSNSFPSPYPYEPSPRASAEDMWSSSRSFKLTRSWSCRENLVTGTSTPPDGLEMNFPGRPESCRTKFPPFRFGSNSKIIRNDSMSSRGSDSTEAAHSVRTPSGEQGFTSIRTFVEGLKEMAKHHGEEENSGKAVKDIGLDAMDEASSGALANWPEQFERQRQAILELWQTCHVSLVHRTYFFLLFKGDEADSIYIGVELRRLSFLKESFSQGNQAVEGGRILTLASSLKTLHRERRMLSKLLGKRFTGAERERLYERFGISLTSKRRRLQLANQLWSNPKDMNRVIESAAIVAKLIRFVEQGKALKEMFGLSFTPSLQTSRRSLGWRKSMAALF